MEEESNSTLEQEAVENNSSSKDNKPKKPSFFSTLIKKISSVSTIIIMLAIAGFAFWLVSNFVYTKKIATYNQKLKHIDVYNLDKKIPPYTTQPLDVMKFTIIDPNTGEQEYLLKIHMILAYDPKYELLGAEILKRKLQIMDLLRNFFQKNSYEDVKGIENINLIRKHIKNYLNSILVNGKLSEVYFEEINAIPR